MTGLLVCAAPRLTTEAVVVVADGSYEAGDERVFWRTFPEHEVLRLPLTTPFSVRPLQVHVPLPRAASAGEIRLALAVRASRARVIRLPD
jgi:hypothetical protein